MAGYTQAGTWLTDDHRILIPQYSENLGGFWYTLDDKAKGGMTRLPGPPPATSGDTSFQPGGQFTTPDPLHPGSFYRDNPTIVGGALDRIDPQGNVVGTFTHPETPHPGGWGWDLTRLNQDTGGPQSVTYKQESGGLFGLPPALGALLGSAMVIGGGFGLGELFAPAAAGAVGAGEAGAVGAGEAAAAAAPEAAASSGLFGTGVSASQALRAASLLNTLVRTGMDPSGGNLGSLVGGLIGSYYGVPGGSVAGRFAGSELEQAAGGGDGSGERPQQTSAGQNWGPLILAAILRKLNPSGGGSQGDTVVLQQPGRRSTSSTSDLYAQVQDLMRQRGTV